MTKPNYIDKAIGAKIRLHRRTRETSIGLLSKKIGKSYQQFQNYETGKNKVSASILFRIASFLGYPINKFFPENEN
tara:strand:- start:108 stop:335 length:228 start_codon:yes stop_codon:yes gene_type:complete